MTRASLRLRGYVNDCLRKEFPGVDIGFDLEQPEFIKQGDLSSNVALALSKKIKKSPMDLAKIIVGYLNENKFKELKNIEIIAPGFINFFLSDEAKIEFLSTFVESAKQFDKKNEKVMVEYTDPNCFKVFHAGHLMSNTIGEALSRVYEALGYEVVRVCYPSDIGRNVAIGVWAVMKRYDQVPGEEASLKDKVIFLGECYSYGNEQFETDEKAKEEILKINQLLYDKSDEKVNTIYEMGRKWSLDYFDEMYALLGTSFDHFIYESEVSKTGLKLVMDNLDNGVFVKSQGAVVYEGEKDGFHTRVFVNNVGLPTYEAKDLGNYKRKIEILPDATYYAVVTANEQNDYFRVINHVAQKLYPNLKEKLIHIGHGILRLPEGKMSSRKGNVLSASDLIEIVSAKIMEKMKEFEGDEESKNELASDIAIGALKFSILKQAPGKDIIFDMDKSISFEGDSGPYLQYTHARMCALLSRAKEEGILPDFNLRPADPAIRLENLLLAHGDILEKSFKDVGPHHIVNYLLELTREFNSLYAAKFFIDKNKPESAYYVALIKSTKNILGTLLNTLGIFAPERM